MSASRVQRLARNSLSASEVVWARKCEQGVLDCARSSSNYISPYGSARTGRFYASLVERTLPVDFNSLKRILELPSISQSFLRSGQIRGYASGFRSQGGRIDIGARARQNQARRLWTIAISGTMVAGFIIVVLNAFQENMMFYITPSQALEKYYINPAKNKFRLGGIVLEGSVHHSKNSAEMEFVVTDLANEILVRYRGALPDLFREGHSVVAEGYLRPLDSYPPRSDPSNDITAQLAEKAKQAGCYFTAVEVLAKHDEKYMPKEVAAAIEKNKAIQEARLAEGVSTGINIQTPISFPIQTSSAGKQNGIAQTPAVAQQYEIRS